MVALIVGIVFMAFAVFACFPPLDWWANILAFLKGSLPVLALFIGLVAVFIGIADIKDKIEAKKEAVEEKKEEDEGKKEATGDKK
jgi:hypothetical protein